MQGTCIICSKMVHGDCQLVLDGNFNSGDFTTEDIKGLIHTECLKEEVYNNDNITGIKFR